MFKAGDVVAIKENRGSYICGPRTLAACEPQYEGQRKVRIFSDDRKRSWIEFDAETGRDNGYPGSTILHWTPEVETQNELYWLQNDVAGLTGERRETQWHHTLTREECQQLIAILKPVRERMKG